MTHQLDARLLEDSLGLLVRHFGVARVRSAFEKVSAERTPAEPKLARGVRPITRRADRPDVTAAIEQLVDGDHEKYTVISTFYRELRDHQVLPDPQDIRHFAQDVGIKQIQGKSRREMLPALISFLIDMPTERLVTSVEIAKGISEQKRKQGFGVLTDKLLSE